MHSIEEMAKELFERVMQKWQAKKHWRREELLQMIEEELSHYNERVRKKIEPMIYDKLSAIFGNELPDIVPTPPVLSQMLHNNAVTVSAGVASLLLEAQAAKATVRELATKLYEGYGFRDKEVLDVKKRLPRYLRTQLKKPHIERRIVSQIERIRTTPLRAAYNGVLQAIEKQDHAALRKAARVALEERARYYATRIAMTETQRASNLARAKEYLDDKEIEFVRYRMSSAHPMVDICDYYANLDVGYGRGIVPKSEMIVLPLHPHCMCRYDPYYLPVKRKKPQQWIEKQSESVQRQVLGGYGQWKRWREGAPIEAVFNMSRPKYPIKRYVEVLGIKTVKQTGVNGSKTTAMALGAMGYNGGMKILTVENATKKEKEVISSWLDFKECRLIRRYFYGDNIPDHFKQKAMMLSTMFKKYDSNLDKNETIYRGIRFKDKDKFDLFVETYKEAHKSGGIIEIDLAPSSFSRSKKVAYEEFALAQREDFYSIVFVLTRRKKGELYIKEFAGDFAYQEEIIVKSHTSKYKIIDIVQSKEYNKTYEVVIEEV